MYNIAHHQIVHGDLRLFLLSAGDGAGSGDHRQQLFRRIAAAGLLNEAERAGDQHHGQDNDHRQRVKILRDTAQKGKVRKHHICHGGNQRQAEQNGGKGVDEGTGKPLGKGLLLFVGHLVAAEFGAADRDGIFVKTPQGGVQVLQNLVDGIGRRKLNAAVLFVTDHALLNLLANSHTIFFLVHGSYLLDFDRGKGNRRKDTDSLCSPVLLDAFADYCQSPCHSPHSFAKYLCEIATRRVSSDTVCFFRCTTHQTRQLRATRSLHPRTSGRRTQTRSP